jgi:hypothetical protein
MLCQDIDKSATVTLKEFYPPKRSHPFYSDGWLFFFNGGPQKVFDFLAGLRSCYFRGDPGGGVNMTAAEWASWVKDVHWGFTQMIQRCAYPRPIKHLYSIYVLVTG